MMWALRLHRFSFILLAPLAALAGFGCGGTPAPDEQAITFDACAPLAVVLDASATQAQRDGLASAVGLWNQTAGTRLVTSADTTTPSVPVHFQTAAALDHGLYDAQTAQIYLNDDLSGSLLPVVMAHEIGHAMGLVHISPGTRVSVMNPGNLSTTPTSDDAAQLAALWGSCGTPDPSAGR